MASWGARGWSAPSTGIPGRVAQQSHRPVLRLTSQGPRPSGELPKLTLSGRGLSTVRLTAYRVSLDGLADTAARAPREPRPGESSFGPDALRRLPRARVTGWTVSLPPPGEPGDQKMAFGAPLLKSGAYVVEATADRLRAYTLVIVSDLVVIRRRNSQSTFVFAADARSGQRIAGARVAAVRYWSDRVRPEPIVAHTGPDGTVLLPLRPRSRGASAGEMLFASRGADVAVLENRALWGTEGPDSPPMMAYLFTDRALYRPGETVRFRQILMQRGKDDDFRPAVGRRMLVTFADPSRRPEFVANLITNEFGSLTGEWTLPVSAPKGTYIARVSLDRGDGTPALYTTGFVVERYGKPQIEASLSPSTVHVRPGERAVMKVRAEYISRGPVRGARVLYRDHFHGLLNYPDPPDPYGVLYWGRPPWMGPPLFLERIYWDRETRTDAKGEATIYFDAWTPLTPDAAIAYNVFVDVRDGDGTAASCRGTLIVGRYDAAVQVNASNGYVMRGDRVQTRITTLNLAEKPISLRGQGRVVRLPDREGLSETLVREAALETDRDGKAVLEWTPETAGQYRMEFLTRDSAGREVKGTRDLWAAGPDLERPMPESPGQLRFKEVALETKERYYSVGDTARALLVTPTPGCSVVLLREAGNRLLDKRVARVPGRAIELSIPLTRFDVPNVYMLAATVRDGKVLQVTREIRVPRLDRLCVLTVSCDRNRYAPGNRARFTLHAHDWKGQPLQAKVSLAISSTALEEVERHVHLDIRRVFSPDPRGHPNPLNHSLEITMPTWESVPPRPGRSGIRPMLTAGFPPISPTAGDADSDLAGISTAGLWAPSVITGPDGTATVEFTWPENLTQWRALAVGVTADGRFGETALEDGGSDVRRQRQEGTRGDRNSEPRTPKTEPRTLNSEL